MRDQLYPCLWYDTDAREAASFYCSVFDKSAVLDELPSVVNFELDGIRCMALNGGPQFKFNPSISFFVTCENDKEVLHYWEQLSAGGSVLMPLDKYDWSEKYGWCADRFGLTWQVYRTDTKEGSQPVTPLLLFSNKQYGNAEKAIRFYTSLFKNSEILGMELYGADAAQEAGKVMHSSFRLDGRMFMAMDGPGDHQFDFNESVSFVMECDTQQEIDYYWEALTRKGEESMCGWCKDQFGVSWQIIPSVLKELMTDRARRQRVTDAFLKMRKFDIEALLNA